MLRINLHNNLMNEIYTRGPSIPPIQTVTQPYIHQVVAIVVVVFLLNLGTFGGGDHFKQDVSTVMVGRLYCALLMCSSTDLLVTQITWWPFQYFTMFMDCSVPMMSICVMLVISLQTKHDIQYNLR